MKNKKRKLAKTKRADSTAKAFWDAVESIERITEEIQALTKRIRSKYLKSKK